MQTVDEFRKSGAYLPEPLKDFHDQKDLFKTMHEAVNVEGHGYAKDVNWVVGQCYVIDIFLWFMAAHGYTLQKSRAKVGFRDLDTTISKWAEARDEAFASVIPQL